jgi:hypothetical protein
MRSNNNKLSLMKEQSNTEDRSLYEDKNLPALLLDDIVSPITPKSDNKLLNRSSSSNSRGKLE